MYYSKFIDSITQVKFSYKQYYRRECKKNQIALHHTVSGYGIYGDINWWLHTPERIATPFLIDRSGKIYQTFSSMYWAHHLGINLKTFIENDLEPGGANIKLNMNSIGIELDSWGGLKDAEKVNDPVRYDGGYRGFEWFEAYTKEQIESLYKLLDYLCDRYGIPRGYNEDMWDVSKRALSGEAGIWSHTSYRPDKSDCHPQPTLIEMLKGL